MMRETLGGITTAYGASYKIEWGRGNPVTYNDPGLVKESLPSIQRVVGNGHLMEPKPQMGAEDFSLYQKVIPGFFFFLGVGTKSRGITAMIHTPEFDVDERAIGIGARVMSTVVVDYLTRHSSNP
jgi:amidohydrolase